MYKLELQVYVHVSLINIINLHPYFAKHSSVLSVSMICSRHESQIAWWQQGSHIYDWPGICPGFAPFSLCPRWGRARPGHAGMEGSPSDNALSPVIQHMHSYSRACRKQEKGRTGEWNTDIGKQYSKYCSKYATDCNIAGNWSEIKKNWPMEWNDHRFDGMITGFRAQFLIQIYIVKSSSKLLPQQPCLCSKTASAHWILLQSAHFHYKERKMWSQT